MNVFEVVHVSERLVIYLFESLFGTRTLQSLVLCVERVILNVLLDSLFLLFRNSSIEFLRVEFRYGWVKLVTHYLLFAPVRMFLLEVLQISLSFCFILLYLSLV